jgi:16S rRNA processing protein RimM
MLEREPHYVRLGHISGVYGVRGWVKVFSFSEPREGIVEYERWLLAEAGTAPEQSAFAVTVEEGRQHGKTVVAKIAGIDDRDAALGLVGKKIYVERSALAACAEGEYYWADLVGLVVKNKAGDVLGTVDHLLATGGNDVMVLAEDARHLIPFAVPDIVLAVDMDDRTITVDWERSYWE